MSARFINVDRDTPMMFLPSLQEWVDENDMVHFVIEAIDAMELPELKVNRRGSGHAQYPPRNLSIVLGAALMHLTRVVDDMIDIPALRKLLLQIAAAGLVVSGVTLIRTVSFPALAFGVIALVQGAILVVVIAGALAGAGVATAGSAGPAVALRADRRVCGPPGASPGLSGRSTWYRE